MIKLDNVVTGVISDTHFPGNLDAALDFVMRTGKIWGIKQWVHIGDMFDHHYMSRHPNELDAYNPFDEHNKAKTEVAKWVTCIPNLSIMHGNHDQIPIRQAQALGIPAPFLQDLNTIYELPKTWRWDWNAQIFGDVLIDHGLGSSGTYACKNTARKLMCSYVQGHTHASGGVFDLPTPFGDKAAMNVGCLIDVNKYNARYGQQIFKVPVSLGIGVICDVNEMYFIKYKE